MFYRTSHRWLGQSRVGYTSVKWSWIFTVVVILDVSVELKQRVLQSNSKSTLMNKTWAVIAEKIEQFLGKKKIASCGCFFRSRKWVEWRRARNHSYVFLPLASNPIKTLETTVQTTLQTAVQTTVQNTSLSKCLLFSCLSFFWFLLSSLGSHMRLMLRINRNDRKRWPDSLYCFRCTSRKEKYHSTFIEACFWSWREQFFPTFFLPVISREISVFFQNYVLSFWAVLLVLSLSSPFRTVMPKNIVLLQCLESPMVLLQALVSCEVLVKCTTVLPRTSEFLLHCLLTTSFLFLFSLHNSKRVSHVFVGSAAVVFETGAESWNASLTTLFSLDYHVQSLPYFLLLFSLCFLCIFNEHDLIWERILNSCGS